MDIDTRRVTKKLMSISGIKPYSLVYWSAPLQCHCLWWICTSHYTCKESQLSVIYILFGISIAMMTVEVTIPAVMQMNRFCGMGSWTWSSFGA